VYQKENLLTKSFVILCVALCDPLPAGRQVCGSSSYY
jgi:hypothetical protein